MIVLIVREDLNECIREVFVVVLFQKLDESVSDNRTSRNLCDTTTRQENEIIDLRRQINNLKGNR